MDGINYTTLISYIDTLGIRVFDFERHITVNEQIGAGSVMNVSKGWLAADGKEQVQVALKSVIKKITSKTHEGILSPFFDDIRQELRVMKHLEDHPNIVNLHGVAFDGFSPVLIVELSIIDLDEYLFGRYEDGNPVSWLTKARFCCEVADGLRALHMVSIVHRDIKGANILLFGDINHEIHLTAKISDFGYSSTGVSIALGRGTAWAPAFRAPEHFGAATETPAVDNYSFGIFVWHVAMDGLIPFDGMNIKEIDDIKGKGEGIQMLLDQLPIDVPQWFRTVIIGMTRLNPADRDNLASVRERMNAEEPSLVNIASERTTRKYITKMAKKNRTISYLTIFFNLQRLCIPIYSIDNNLKCTFTLDEEIGRGGAMTVYRATLCRDGQEQFQVALKIPNKSIKENHRSRDIDQILSPIRQELRMMKHLEAHPNIVDLYGVAFKGLTPILIVECASGNLKDYLKERFDNENPVSWAVKAKFCCETADGLMALHMVDIVHGDIKGDNILLFGNINEENDLTAKISDFGYSSTKVSINLGGGTGVSPHFCAPECTPYISHDMKEWEQKSTKDNYSFGLFVWQVAADGDIPYDGLDVESICKIKSSEDESQEIVDDLPEDVPDYFKTVIINMIQYKPEKRANLASIRHVMMDSEDRYSERKLAFIASAKAVPLDTEMIEFENLPLMSIPQPVKARVIHEYEIIALKRFADEKAAFESNAREIPSEFKRPEFKTLQLMSIPQEVKTKMIDNLEKDALEKDAEAAYLLSVCFGSGFGVGVDMEKMVWWATRAAEYGSLDAIKNITEQYEIQHLPDNRTILFPWLLSAASAGHRESQIKVAQCYHEGIGVEKDILKYEEWMSVAGIVG